MTITLDSSQVTDPEIAIGSYVASHDETGFGVVTRMTRANATVTFHALDRSTHTRCVALDDLYALDATAVADFLYTATRAAR